MSLVSLVKIQKENEATKKAISESLNLINYSFSGDLKKVVIKPNLCYYWDASTGQTTEPAFVSSLIDLIREKNPDAEISIVESDASAMRCKYAFRMLGYEKLAKEKSIRLVNLSEDKCEEADIACNDKSYKFSVSHAIKEADLKINVAHIKYTVDPIKLTCALKNIYGCNPNPRKFKYHQDLANVIVALNKAMKFDLHLIDNNIAAGVQPRRLGLVMASRDPVAMDAAAAKIAWLNPNKIGYFSLAEREGLGTKKYVAVGEPLETFRALYPKRTLKLKMKAQAYKFVVRSGLGSKLGIE